MEIGQQNKRFYPEIVLGSAKSYFVQPSTDCLVKGSPGEMTL